MTYTKERVADAAANARPYVERALRDQELRESIRNAYTSARAVFDAAFSSNGAATNGRVRPATAKG